MGKGQLVSSKSFLLHMKIKQNSSLAYIGQRKHNLVRQKKKLSFSMYQSNYITSMFYKEISFSVRYSLPFLEDALACIPGLWSALAVTSEFGSCWAIPWPRPPCGSRRPRSQECQSWNVETSTNSVQNKKKMCYVR